MDPEPPEAAQGSRSLRVHMIAPCQSALAGWPRPVCNRLCVALASLGIAASPVSAAQPHVFMATAASVRGTVEYQRPGTEIWLPLVANQVLLPGDKVRTWARSGATVTISTNTTIRLGELSLLEVRDPQARRATGLIGLLKGALFLLHRGDPGDFELMTRTATAAVRGTEFVARVDESDRLTVSTIEGRVALGNDAGTVELRNGEEGAAVPGEPPRKTAKVDARNVIQWCLYYPAVLDPAELRFDSATERALQESLASYRAGDLPHAVQAYPPDRMPASDSERAYRAALWLTAGSVNEADPWLRSASAGNLESALRYLVAAVRLERLEAAPPARSASEWLGLSYYRQSLHDIEGAREAAANAVSLSPGFALGWARLAEMEYCLGRLGATDRALAKALGLAPRHAQARALQGYVLLGRLKPAKAADAFTEALALDGALGSAWLGRGLARLSLGDRAGGKQDLLMAAAAEPQRSLFRSYLGKAFAEAGDGDRALQELERAQALDPQDPTPWFYLALLRQRRLQYGDAIRDLEEAMRRNDHRAIYRSRLLLDQDQAVRSANLASIFADADMKDVTMRESARAVSLDYANASAHLNLAGSLNALRDPTRFNLRYESEWFNEHLLASLLAPAGAFSLSPNVSQQECSPLFAENRLGFASTTEYLGTGELRQTASQFGSFGGTSYSLDLEYQHNQGVRVNNGLDRIEWYSRIKQRITAQDALLLLVERRDYESGDNFQYYDPSAARPAFHYSESPLPQLLGGWHHEWSPGVHTLFLGGRLANEQQLSDTNTLQTVAVANPAGVVDPRLVPFDASYRNESEVYCAELNQIIQGTRHTDILGVRFQEGMFDAKNAFDNPPPGMAPLFTLPSVSTTDGEFRRLSLYAYHHWQVVDNLLLIGGVAYDDLDYPANYRRPPLHSDTADHSQVSPKAALLWDITPRMRARAAYAQAVGGVSDDENVRLEPTQLAGFGQSFRTLISESLVGSVEAPRYDLLGAALDLRPWQDAWLSLQGEAVRERVDREIGLFNYSFGNSPPTTPAATTEQLDYHEYTARLVFNQLIGSAWYLEAAYQFMRSELEETLPDIAATPGYARTTRTDANLHEFRVSGRWQHPSGVFVRVEFRELIQQLGGSNPQPPGDDFPLLNAYVGYRFPRKQAEFTLGAMNLCGEDYHFSPLNYHPEYPHERALYAAFKFNF